MSGILNIESGANKSQPPAQESKTEAIPPEILGKIFSYLNRSEILRVSSVSRAWNAAAINAFGRREFHLIEQFLKFVCKNLDEERYSSKIENLQALLSDRRVLGRNIIEIKCSIFFIKEKILDELQNLDDRCFDLLAKNNKDLPLFFDDLVELAKTQKKLIHANKNHYERKRIPLLREIFRKVQRSGYLEAALGPVNAIPNEQKRLKELMEIFRASIWVRSGFIEKALVIARAMQQEEAKDFLLLHIVNALIRIPDIEKAKEIANTISDERYREYAEEAIAKADSSP